MAGFTIGNKVIYKNLHSLKAGEVVLLQNDSYKYLQYYRYFIIDNSTLSSTRNEVEEIHKKILRTICAN